MMNICITVSEASCYYDENCAIMRKNESKTSNEDVDKSNDWLWTINWFYFMEQTIVKEKNYRSYSAIASWFRIQEWYAYIVNFDWSQQNMSKGWTAAHTVLVQSIAHISLHTHKPIL